jgi:hypothetical protein
LQEVIYEHRHSTTPITKQLQKDPCEIEPLLTRLGD